MLGLSVPPLDELTAQNGMQQQQQQQHWQRLPGELIRGWASSSSSSSSGSSSGCQMR
jgi:hypothetical protein